jgi:MFS family permease
MAVWGVPLLAVSMVALLWWLWRLLHGDLNRNVQVVGVFGIIGVAASVAQVALAAWALRLQQRSSAPGAVDEATRLDRAAQTVAVAVKVQWEDEAGTRGLRHPRPLRLYWTTTDRPVAALAESISNGPGSGQVVEVRLRGSLDEVAERFLALPNRRLVVLGEPGAGKTVLVMLLTLQVLDRREHDAPQLPVPVLLSLSSWDPTVEHLHAWIGRRLTEDYPALANTAAYGPHAAQDLIQSERLLPILDGLDELPTPLQGTAIEALDRAHSGPLVVTCRSVEFEQAVAAGGTLAAAAVVELQPATVQEVISFLRAAAVPHEGRWDQVFVHLRAFPTGTLARILASPLMAALARTVYTAPGRQPSDLVKLAQSNDQPSIEQDLLDGFVPAVYAASPPAPGTPQRNGRSWSPQQADRWLRLLARHLHRHRTRDLAWWQLDQLVPRPVIGLTFGIAGAVVGMLAGAVVGGVVAAVVGGVAGGGLVGLLVAFEAPSPPPARIDIQIRGRLGALVRGLAGSLIVWVGAGVAGMLAAWLVFWFVVWLQGGPTSETPGGVVTWFVIGLVVGLVVGFVRGLLNWAQTPADSALAADPRSVLRGSRGLLIGQVVTSMLACAVAGAVAAGLALVELKFGLTYGLTVGLVFGLYFALGAAPYGRFSVAQAWLALRGRLPWPLMAFLNDAHQRGVFRQAGAVHQFRHARLQDHLASDQQPSP